MIFDLERAARLRIASISALRAGLALLRTGIAAIGILDSKSASHIQKKCEMKGIRDGLTQSCGVIPNLAQ